MTVKGASVLILGNALLAAALIVAYAFFFAPPRAPILAVLDVTELYRLKERQVAAVLTRRDAADEERALALARASTFGLEVTKLLESLPEECRCLVLARGAVLAPSPLLHDLTPDVRRRLGL